MKVPSASHPVEEEVGGEGECEGGGGGGGGGGGEDLGTAMGVTSA